MPRILKKRLIRAPDVFYYNIDAPLISKKAQPGQFVIIRLHEKGERIPLSLADINPEEETISVIVMAIGKTTTEMSLLREGDEILDLCGPLGQPTHIERAGRIVVVGGGFGFPPLYPISRAFKRAGNEVVAVMGARNKYLLIYEEEMRDVCDRLVITTNDGSRGLRGLVTDALRKEIERNGTSMVITIGPTAMMRAVCEVTRPFGIETVVSLNPIMIDGTGMCGCCRVNVGGRAMFACVDGPDFNGHEIDWDTLISRQKAYIKEEKESFEEWKRRHASILYT